MINFRYHIVSLTAVFLALLIGILMGTTVVSKATVDGLKSNLQRAEARSAAVHRTNDRLSTELSKLTDSEAAVDDALTDHALANAVEGALDDVPVLIIAADDVDKDVLEQSARTLLDAGATVEGTLVVSDRMVLSDSDAERLRGELSLGPDADVQAALVRRLGIALAQAALPDATIPGAVTTTTSTTTSTVPTDRSEEPDATEPSERPPEDSAPDTEVAPPPPEQPEVVTMLRRDGFLSFRAPEGGSNDAAVLEAPQLADGIGYRYVVLGSTEPDPVSATVLAPLVATLAKSGPVAQVAAAGPKDPADPGDDPFLGPLLERDGVKGQVSTVDNLGSFAGDVALAYALAAAGDGHFGSYGIGGTASSVLPTFERSTE